MSTIDTPARESYDVIIKDYVAPVMKAAGFKRSGTQWRLRGESAWGVVSMQKSSFSSRDEISFTINLGVRFDALHRAQYPNAKWMWERAPAEYDCHGHAHTRVGFLMPEPHDHWWKVVDHRDVPKIVGVLIPLLCDQAVPWVLSTMNDVIMAASVLDDYIKHSRR